MHVLCHSNRPLLQHFNTKQQAYIKKVHKLPTQDAMIIGQKFKGKYCSLIWTQTVHKREEFNILQD